MDLLTSLPYKLMLNSSHNLIKKSSKSQQFSQAPPIISLFPSSFRISNQGRKARIFACLDGNNLDKGGLSSNKEASIDLKLPRRRLLVQFTCNECGERTERLINPLAYERGTVFVQCAGCLVRHKLVDNLGLVVEYDLRDETNNENIDA